MSDYISRSKLIKDVENLQDCYNGFSDTYDKACIIGLIAEQPSIEELQKPKWIPVTERLPEENEVVLVADKANDIGMGSLQPLWHGVVWVVPFEDVDNEFCSISYWMPLPEPPKDGEP